MGKRKAVDLPEIPAQEVLLTPEPVVVNLAPLVDEAITKVRQINSVGHMFYVDKFVQEALDSLQTLRNSV